jgi:hypothetical protein
MPDCPSQLAAPSKPAPFFKRTFSGPRLKYRGIFFDIYEPIHAISTRETGDCFRFMFGNTAGKIIGNASVKRSVAATGKDVDAILLCHRSQSRLAATRHFSWVPDRRSGYAVARPGNG